MKKMKMLKKQTSADNSLNIAVRAVMLGTVLGAVICSILLVLCAFILMSSKVMPQSMIAPITLAIAGISSFFAGYITARKKKEQGMLFGALSAFLLFILIFLTGYIVLSTPFSATSVTKGLVMVICGAIGGVLAVNKRSKVK